MQSINWNFDNSYAKLPKIFYSRQLPTPVKEPKLVIFNNSLAKTLGVPFNKDVFAGNEVPSGAEPLSLAYAGHQFGHFAMLGDGRAVLLGEHVTSGGKRLDIQLKGSGKTIYSRGGDGRAAIAPMLREYIMSEAMHALNIPTTRSLAVLETGEFIMRERKLRGAVLLRVASSHIRVGTFEFAHYFGSNYGIKTLADYTIARHFKNLENNENKYLLMLREIINLQAQLISKWQLVGFIHGVMNTDNMAISGETIDYGPCAFMDSYNIDTVFSSIDTYGRYSYKNQPKMAKWNLTRLAETLIPLLHKDENKAIELAENEINNFISLYENYFFAGMGAKLGLFEKRKEDEMLIDDLLNLMQQFNLDYTNTFKNLTLGENISLAPNFINWQKMWQQRLKSQQKTKKEVEELMKSHNPAIIPRNHQVEEALSFAENGDLSKTHKLLSVLNNPYSYAFEQIEFSKLNVPLCNCNYQTFCGT